jgi:hypothetical protein
MFGAPKNPASGLQNDDYLQASKVPKQDLSIYRDPFGTNIRNKSNQKNGSLLYKDPMLRSQAQHYGNLLNYAGSQLGRPDNQKLEQYRQAYYNRAMAPVQQRYDQATSGAREQFNSMGLLNSTGYEDYRRDNLDRLHQEGMQKAGEDAYMASQQLRAADDQRNLSIGQFAQQGMGDVQNLGLQKSDLSRLLLGMNNQYQNDFYRNQLNRLSTQGSFM